MYLVLGFLAAWARGPKAFASFALVEHAYCDLDRALAMLTRALEPRTQRSISIDTHLDRQLEITQRYRGGYKRRAIWMSDASPSSLAEARRTFGRYGIEVLETPRVGNGSEKATVEDLLRIRRPDLKILGVMKESSAGGKRALVVQTLDKGRLNYERYMRPPQGSVGTLYSEYIARRIHYPELRNLKHQPPPVSRVVDFDVDPAKYVASRGMGNNEWSQRYGVAALVEQSMNGGLFFRAPRCRMASCGKTSLPKRR